MNAKERMIAEKRQIEATRKNFMGASGKLGMIAKVLGQPIQRQGSPMYDTSYLEDPYDNIDPDKLPQFDGADEFVVTEGYLFDGTSSGVHMEIKLMAAENKLRVTWRGYTVYEEMAGDLLAYVPKEDWEEWVDRLWRRAKDKSKQQIEAQKPLIEEETQSQLGRFLDRMRRRWGV
jgi:hypothetical protein